MDRKFIINALSGKNISMKQITKMKNYFEKKIGTFDYIIPKNREDTISITKELLLKKIKQIIAVGGDGTINSVVNGFFENEVPINSEALLVVSNAGTGHDYSKSILGKSKFDWKELVFNHTVKTVDVGMIKYISPIYKTTFFDNMASVAMIPYIVEMKNKLPSFIPAKLKYLIPTIKALITYKPKKVKLELDEGIVETEILFISISKGTYAGGGMKFGSKASLFNGLFDITILEPMNPLKMLTKLIKIYTGSYENEQGIQKYKSSSVKIFSDTSIPIELDGELYGTTNAEFKVLPKSIKICFPKE